MSTNQEHFFGEAVGVYGPPTKQRPDGVHGLVELDQQCINCGRVATSAYSLEHQNPVDASGNAMPAPRGHDRHELKLTSNSLYEWRRHAGEFYLEFSLIYKCDLCPDTYRYRYRVLDGFKDDIRGNCE